MQRTRFSFAFFCSFVCLFTFTFFSQFTFIIFISIGLCYISISSNRYSYFILIHILY